MFGSCCVDYCTEKEPVKEHAKDEAASCCEERPEGGKWLACMCGSEPCCCGSFKGGMPAKGGCC